VSGHSPATLAVSPHRKEAKTVEQAAATARYAPASSAAHRAGQAGLVAAGQREAGAATGVGVVPAGGAAAGGGGRAQTRLWQRTGCGTRAVPRLLESLPPAAAGTHAPEHGCSARC
jgi:hypothetical protein